MVTVCEEFVHHLLFKILLLIYTVRNMEKDFIQLEPSLIAADWARMGEEVVSCQKAGVRILHLDVMDGHFVPNFTMGPDLVRAVKRAAPDMILDIHLMVYSPEEYIEAFAKNGAGEITFHLEATEDVLYTIQYIKKCNCKAGLAIKPETSASLVLKYIEAVDKILIMTVEPGFGGQAFMKKMLEKVKFVRDQADRMGKKIDIQVDGGIDLKTGAESILAGANRLVCGTYFFNCPDRKEVLKKFNELRKLREF